MLNKRLTEIRIAHKMTRKETANKLNIHETTYGKYELGERAPSFDILMKICDLFNVSTDYLLGRAEVVYAAKHEEKIIELTEFQYNFLKELDALSDEDLGEILRIAQYIKHVKRKKS